MHHDLNTHVSAPTLWKADDAMINPDQGAPPQSQCTRGSFGWMQQYVRGWMMRMLRRAISQTRRSRNGSLTCKNQNYNSSSQLCSENMLKVCVEFAIFSLFALMTGPTSSFYPLSPVSWQESSEDWSRRMNSHSFQNAWFREEGSKIQKLVQSRWSTAEGAVVTLYFANSGGQASPSSTDFHTY